MHFRNAHIVALQETPEDLRQETALDIADTADDAEIDKRNLALRRENGVAFMHVGMEDAVIDGAGEEALGDVIGELLAVYAGLIEHAGRGERGAFNPFGCHHTLARALPIHLRHTEETGLLVDFPHFVCPARFQA